MFEGYTDAGFTCTITSWNWIDMGHFPKGTTEQDLLEHDQESLRTMWVEKHLALLLNQYDMNKQTEWGYEGEQDPHELGTGCMECSNQACKDRRLNALTGLVWTK